jgi:hypothetical protein
VDMGQFLLVHVVWYVVVPMRIRLHKKESGSSVRGEAQSKMWLRMKWLKAANVDINLCFRRRLAGGAFCLALAFSRTPEFFPSPVSLALTTP